MFHKVGIDWKKEGGWEACVLLMLLHYLLLPICRSSLSFLYFYFTLHLLLLYVRFCASPFRWCGECEIRCCVDILSCFSIVDSKSLRINWAVFSYEIGLVCECIVKEENNLVIHLEYARCSERMIRTRKFRNNLSWKIDLYLVIYTRVLFLHCGVY